MELEDAGEPVVWETGTSIKSTRAAVALQDAANAATAIARAGHGSGTPDPPTHDLLQGNIVAQIAAVLATESSNSNVPDQLV